MEKEKNQILCKDKKAIDTLGCEAELARLLKQTPDIAKPLLKKAKMTFAKFENSLCVAPLFINAIQATIPDVTLQAVLTNEQKRKIAEGALNL